MGSSTEGLVRWDVEDLPQPRATTATVCFSNLVSQVRFQPGGTISCLQMGSFSLGPRAGFLPNRPDCQHSADQKGQHNRVLLHMQRHEPEACSAAGRGIEPTAVAQLNGDGFLQPTLQGVP